MNVFLPLPARDPLHRYNIKEKGEVTNTRRTIDGQLATNEHEYTRTVFIIRFSFFILIVMPIIMIYAVKF